MRLRHQPCPALALLALLAIAPTTAVAATATTTFNVAATVVSACIVSAMDMVFGNYDTTSLIPATVTGSISVRCALLTPYHVRLNKGSYGTDVQNRKMKGPGVSDYLNYSLYRDLAHTQNWGETEGADTVDGVGTGLTADHAVYGRIPAEQNVNTGAYADVVTVTVSY